MRFRNEELISNLRKEASQSEARLRAEAKQAEEALRAQAARDAAAAEQRAEAAARAAGEKHQQECAELNAKISAAQSSHSKLQGEFAALQATSQQTMVGTPRNRCRAKCGSGRAQTGFAWSGQL